MRTLAVLLVMITPLAACGSDDDSDASCDPEAAAEVTTGELPEDLPDIVCESVEDATATLEDAGFEMRVVSIDGEDQAVTADFVENRVNVAVETQGDTTVVTGIVSMG